MNSALANYKIGLVMGHAGMNPVQVKEVRRRLKEIAKLGGALPDGLALSVPAVRHHCGPQACEETEALLKPLMDLDYLRITVLDLGPVSDVLYGVLTLDEVWCLPAPLQARAAQRPMKVYKLARAELRNSNKFKIIEPWADNEHVTGAIKASIKKPERALKGW